MARIKLHSETVGLDRTRLRARLAELAAKYPGAEIKSRRLPNYGWGYTINVHGEGAATRVQLRGHCQFCGNHQVVKDGELVLHGYQRPGHGWIFGRCPGAGQKPLQADEAITRAALSAAQNALALVQPQLPAAQVLEATTQAAKSAAQEYGDYTRPTKPYNRGQEPTEEQTAAFRAALAAWRVQYPKTAVYLDAVEARRSLEQRIIQLGGQIDHFELLLSWKLLGTELKRVEK